MTSRYGKSPSYAFIRDVSTTNIPSTEENVNTQNSIPDTKADREYLSAVKSGDMETVQRLVDEAAKEAGYTVKAYHGTRNSDFTIFNRN